MVRRRTSRIESLPAPWAVMSFSTVAMPTVGTSKPHVLVGVGGLAEDPSLALTEFAGTFDQAVGAFHGFDGDDVAVFAGEGLADEEFVDAFEEGPGEVDVDLDGGGGFGAGHDAFGGEGFGHVGPPVNEFDSAGREFVGEGFEERGGALVVFDAHEPDASGAPVGHFSEEVEAFVHVGLADAADHDGLGAAFAAEFADPLVDAEEADFVEGIAEGAEVVDAGLSGEGGADDAVSGGAHAAPGGFEGEGCPGRR